jgi:hypothetical protein
MPIKTFRGLMATDTQDTIVLHTNDGSTGYRIVKFQVIPENPFAAADKELVFKIYKIPQTAQDGVISFSDQTLLATAIYSDSDGSAAPVTQTTDSVIFDNEIFNQDIYVTYVDKHGSQSANYYIELEQIKLSLDENTVATLKDLRNITAPT